MSKLSHACCTVPPVISKGYKEKGQYITLAGKKTYVTGPETAKTGILIIFDIFGFFPQTIQGADILAHGDSEKGPYQVFMPDLFDGKPMGLEQYPPKTEEQKQMVAKFFATTAAPQQHVEKIPQLVKEAGEKRGVQTWGILGFCWASGVVSPLSRSGTPFKAAAVAHPASVNPEDAPKIAIPFALLPSGHEDKDTMIKHQEALKTESILEFFPTQTHGFMAARANLEDENVRSEYQRGYKTLLDFYHNYL